MHHGSDWVNVLAKSSKLDIFSKHFIFVTQLMADWVLIVVDLDKRTVEMTEKKQISAYKLKEKVDDVIWEFLMLFSGVAYFLTSYFE